MGIYGTMTMLIEFPLISHGATATAAAAEPKRWHILCLILFAHFNFNFNFNQNIIAVNREFAVCSKS